MRGAELAAELRATDMRQVTVRLGPRSYPLLVGSGIVAELGPRLALGRFPERVAVVTDARVAQLHLDRVLASLREAGFSAVPISIPGGEEHKNLAWLAFLYDKLVEARLDRGCAVVALGGGVVGDLAGFAAATFLRGLPLVQVPTTLLAQVDASVGGKTGINHAAGKNLIGAFYQPRLVLADVELLRTLPRRELLAGVAEVVKYGAALDAALFRRLEERLADVLALDSGLLVEVVATCCELKARVVEEDETESERRSILNFGHTVAHAVETLTEYRELLHGEAVAIGMVAAARVSRQRGRLRAAAVARLERLLRRAGLPVEVPGRIGRDALALAMETDKKSKAGRIRFVCLEAIGRTRFEYLTAREIAGQI